MARAPRKGISRFIVMAVLQAARARRLGLSEDSALSWGLNRSIFYAAAKRGFKGKSGSGAPGANDLGKEPRASYTLGDEKAYRDPESKNLYFTIGGETQTAQDFERQVGSRFGGASNFGKAWEEAVAIVGSYDEEVLKSGRGFYERVYKPRRDELASKWTELFIGVAVG